MRVQRQVKHVIGNRQKGDPCSAVAESLAKLSSGVTWQAEALSDKLSDRSKEISKASVKGAA